MVCIRLKRRRILKNGPSVITKTAICIALLLLTACNALNKSKPSAESDIAFGEEGQILEPIANPYLSQAITPPEGAQALFTTALDAIQKKDWKAAIGQLTAMTTAFPQLSGPYVNLGIVYWKKNDIKQARAAFNKAIEVNSLNSDAYLQFALMLREQGQFTNAEALYTQAIEVWPHNTQAHLGLGILYDMYMGLFVDALGHYEMAQKLHSKPDRRLAGWIIDTKRRLPKVQAKAVTKQEAVPEEQNQAPQNEGAEESND